VPKFFLRFAGFALAVCAVAIAPLASTARAQTTTVPVTFNGTVSISASDTVSIRQADGSYAAYTGSLPAFPYQDGQAVSISFNATVPSAAWYAANPSAAAMTQAADGVYRITLYSDTSGLAGLMIPGIARAARRMFRAGSMRRPIRAPGALRCWRSPCSTMPTPTAIPSRRAAALWRLFFGAGLCV
jgi:hypothetical protein